MVSWYLNQYVYQYQQLYKFEHDCLLLTLFGKLYFAQQVLTISMQFAIIGTKSSKEHQQAEKQEHLATLQELRHHLATLIKGTPPDLKGKNTFLLLTVVFLRVLRFLPTIPPLGGGMPPMI